MKKAPREWDVQYSQNFLVGISFLSAILDDVALLFMGVESI